MKLTSRALKVGDTIIRKSPLTNNGEVTNASHTTTPVTVVEKHPHHTVVKAKHFDTEVKDILAHYKWNDNEWVRFKTSNNE